MTDDGFTAPPMQGLKWAPLLALLLGTATMVVEIAFYRWHMAGMLLNLAIIAYAATLAWRGPMRKKQVSEETDEREALWRDRSNLFAFGAVALVALAGLFGFGFYGIWVGLTGWTMQSAKDTPFEIFGTWLTVWARYVMLLFLTLPTLHASWTMPELIEDEGGLRFVRPRKR